MRRSAFLNSSPLKWGVALLLFSCSAFLLLWKPAPRKLQVVLLPFTDVAPVWNGSYPFLTISLVDHESERNKFKGSVLLIRPTIRHDSPVNEFQVDLHSGMFVLRQTDLFIPDVMPLALTRTYRGWDYDQREKEFGRGANHPYDICPTMTRFPYTYMDLVLEDFRQIHFPRVSKGTGYADAVFRYADTSSEFYGAQMSWNGDGWTLEFRDGRRLLFPEAYNGKTFAQGAPFEMQDGKGHRIEFKRDKERRLEQLIAPSGHRITFKYDEADRIVEAIDDAGNLRKYTYDPTSHLESVANATGLLYRFEYAPRLHVTGYDPYLMTGIFDGTGQLVLRNIFNDSDGGRISEQRLGNGDVYQFHYILAKQGIVETVVDGPIGKEKLFFQHGILTKVE